MENNIVQWEYSPWAWTYWPKTRTKLQAIYSNFLEEEEQKQIFLAKIEGIKKEALEEAKKHVENIEKPIYGEISPQVRELQKVLASFW